jgi:AcrR family transcriptional regulator
MGIDRRIRTRALQAEKTRATLVRTARLLFAKKGYHDTGTTEIVAKARVTRGALYHHFASKEDLFLAVFKDVQQEMAEKSKLIRRRASGTGDLWKMFRQQVSAFLRATSAPELQRILLLDGPVVLGWARWRELEAEYGLGVIVDAIEDGVSAGAVRPQPAEPLAHLVLSIIDEGALLVANAPDPEAAASEVETALDTLLSTLT